jgi:hypothetical protein
MHAKQGKDSCLAKDGMAPYFRLPEDKNKAGRPEWLAGLVGGLH